MKKDCWWNQPLAKSGKDTASLETANTVVSQPESTMIGMRLQSDGSTTVVGPTKWMFSVLLRIVNQSENEFLVDSGTGTSLCQQCF